MPNTDALIEKVRKSHSPTTIDYDDEVCARCDEDWPCSPVRLADALTVMRATAERWSDYAKHLQFCSCCVTKGSSSCPTGRPLRDLATGAVVRTRVA
jgi:hypothetical protein